MQLALTLLASCTSLVLVVSATPVNYFAPRVNAPAATHYSNGPCEQQRGACEQGPQMQQTPSFFASGSTQAPVMKQVFTTITRKHDNLNTAEANHKKSINIKYQTGPSVEVEGEFTKSASAKQSGSEAPSSSGYVQSEPGLLDIQMEPEQNKQLETPNQDYQSTEMTGSSTESQPVLMEEPQVDEQSQPEQIQ
ncbi:hypothetical protein K7432_016880, partial [Basidiobolus ranarum]